MTFYTGSTGIDTDYLGAIPKAQFNPASLTSTYQVINGNGFGDTVKILKMYNPSSTISIDISLDGVNDHDFLPPNGTIILDLQANHAENPNGAGGTKYGRLGQLIYAKTAAQPTYVQIIGFR